MKKDNKKETVKVVNEGRPRYKHTPLGWIPIEWEGFELGEVTKKIMVGIATESRSSVRESGVPFIRNQNIKSGHFDDQEIIYISKEFDLLNKNKRLKAGDVIIVRTGSNVGQACVVPSKFENAQTFTTLIVRPSEKLDSNYLSLHINSFGIREVERLSAGGGKPNLNAGFLESYRILLPPISEQRKIESILSIRDCAIAKTQQLIEQLKRRNKGLMQELLTGSTRLPGFTDTWKEVHLREAFSERIETGLDTLELLSVGSNGIYPQSQSEKRDISNSDKSKYKRIYPGDIGYNTMRMWQGRSALSSLEGIISPAYTVITPKNNQSGLFYSLLFQLPSVINKFFRNSQGLVEDTLNCKFRDLAKVKVYVPEYKEQLAISKVLVASQQEIIAHETLLVTLLKSKKGLTQKLLKGEIRIK